MTMHHGLRGRCVFVLLVWLSGPKLPKPDNCPRRIRNRRPFRLSALEPDESVTMDGRLDEAAWARADPATGFRQSDPQNGEPATERSEIRILFSRDSLYIGAEFFDSDPAGVLGNSDDA